MSDAPGPNVFFVCGAPKSGTTWLQRVLDSHPEIQCSGEGHFIEHFYIPLAELLKNYNKSMQVVGERVYEGKPYYPGVELAGLDHVARAFIADRLRVRAPGPGIKWIGDKTPRYVARLPILHRLFPEARIINIVRDPRDGAMSRMAQGRRAGLGDEVAEGTARRIEVIRMGAEDWARSVKAVEEFSAQHPGLTHSLRYEDMLADPAGEAGKLFRFLAVDDRESVVSQVVAQNAFEAVSGRKPGEEDASAFLRKGVAGDWIGKLEPEALAAIEAACGDLMRAYGYV